MKLEVNDTKIHCVNIRTKILVWPNNRHPTDPLPKEEPEYVQVDNQGISAFVVTNKLATG